MDLLPLLTWMQETGVAVTVRDSLYLFPLLEAVHVIGLALVFGTIAVIDLRLLGVASSHRSFGLMASEIMAWTWAAFALTALTGALMFITNAAVYYNNIYFRVKIGLLVLAGLNVFVFELTPEVMDVLRYGRGVDNRRLIDAGFRYGYTSAGTVQAFVEAMRLRDTVGQPEGYRYERDVENFFRHSPAVVREPAE